MKTESTDETGQEVKKKKEGHARDATSSFIQHARAYQLAGLIRGFQMKTAAAKTKLLLVLVFQSRKRWRLGTQAMTKQKKVKETWHLSLCQNKMSLGL